MDIRLENLFEYKQPLPIQTPRSLPNERGVVLFADPDHRPILLLRTASIRRTVLSKWTPSSDSELSRKADLRSIASAIFYTLLPSEYHSCWLYNRLVHLLFPQQVQELLSLPPAHCVRLALQDPWAAFSVSSHPLKDEDSLYWGPFPSRREADFFARTWNELFSLCRNRSLALSGNGRKCTYFQMNLCPADCQKDDADALYRERVNQAARATQSPPEAAMASLQAQMKTLASQLQFEQAQIIKKKLESLEKLQTLSYRWTTDLNQLKILHISEGPRVRLAKRTEPLYLAYMITARTTEKLLLFSLDSLEQFCEALQSPPGRCILKPQDFSEHLSLLSLFLYKSEPAGLWLDLNKTPDIQTLRFQILETFGRCSSQDQ